MVSATKLVRVLNFDSIDSTNAEAHRLALDGELGPLWIRAGEQTAGRGRQGRAWVSESGNLYATLLMTLPVPPHVATQMSFVASLAVRDALAAFLPAPSGLAVKWPNDILLDGCKISGILTETTGPASLEVTVAAIGCGLNLKHAPAETRCPATSLAAHGIEAEPGRAFRELAAGMDRWLAAWDEGRGFARIRQAWLAAAFRLGQEVTIVSDGSPVKGTFSGLADDGAMILVDRDDTRRSFHAGEVSLDPTGLGSSRS